MKYAEYREEKKHGSDEFPLQYYYIDSDSPEYVMQLHWHSELEIVRVIEGKFTLWLDNEKYELFAGDVVFIEGGAIHRGEPDECRYECAVFNPRFVSGQMNSRLAELVRPLCSGEAHLLPYCPPANQTAKSLLDTAREESPYYELKLAALICELIGVFYSEGAIDHKRTSDKRETRRRKMISLLFEKIERDYAGKITIAELAAIAGVTEKYLCRFFKEVTGYTPIDYINRVRIEHSCYEMKFNRRSVMDAAYESGFNEIGYFYKCFKKYKGVPPGKYR